MNTSTLLERIDRLINYFSLGSLAHFAEISEVSRTTLYRNLKDKREDLLLKITPNILQNLPTVRKEWLLNGQGEMLDKTQLTDVYYDKLLQYQNENTELGNTLASVQNELDQAKQHIIGMEQELRELRKEVAHLQKELLAAKDEALALYRRMEKPKTTEGKAATAPAPGSAAPGTSNVAPL